MNTEWHIALPLLIAIFTSSHAITKRTVYTVFPDGHTWNEAKVICEGQFGQLLKVTSDKQLQELRYIDGSVWSNAVQRIFTSGAHIWTGLHTLPKTGDIVYQDCETQSMNVTVMTGVGTNDLCAALRDWNTVQWGACDEAASFICQRQEGDCWYEPHVDEAASVETSRVTITSTSPTECALKCRNDVIGGVECWAITFETTTDACQIHYVSVSDAMTLSSTSPSVFYNHGGNRVTSVDTVFYVRKCIEGVLDTATYSNVNNADSVPDSICTTAVYEGEPVDEDICLCTSTVKPAIPEPKTTDQKVEELVQELTIDTRNTSSARRKLASAEDTRTSAVSVGYIGVALIVAVFGGLFLLDSIVLYTGICGIVSAFKQRLLH